MSRWKLNHVPVRRQHCGIDEHTSAEDRVVRLRDSKNSCVPLDDVPDHLLCHFLTPNRARPTDPPKKPAIDYPAVNQSSIVRFTLSGTGMARTCLASPTRSTIAQLSSRRCRCSRVRSVNSRRRSPQPKSTARIDRSRLPLSVVGSHESRKQTHMDHWQAEIIALWQFLA